LGFFGAGTLNGDCSLETGAGGEAGGEAEEEEVEEEGEGGITSYRSTPGRCSGELVDGGCARIPENIRRFR
jgi:hypothetical protein